MPQKPIQIYQCLGNSSHKIESGTRSKQKISKLTISSTLYWQKSLLVAIYRHDPCCCPVIVSNICNFVLEPPFLKGKFQHKKCNIYDNKSLFISWMLLIAFSGSNNAPSSSSPCLVKIHICIEQTKISLVYFCWKNFNFNKQASHLKKAQKD